MCYAAVFVFITLAQNGQLLRTTVLSSSPTAGRTSHRFSSRSAFHSPLPRRPPADKRTTLAAASAACLPDPPVGNHWRRTPRIAAVLGGHTVTPLWPILCSPGAAVFVGISTRPTNGRNVRPMEARTTTVRTVVFQREI